MGDVCRIGIITRLGARGRSGPAGIDQHVGKAGVGGELDVVFQGAVFMPGVKSTPVAAHPTTSPRQIFPANP